jgi:hypothetical protein
MGITIRRERQGRRSDRFITITKAGKTASAASETPEIEDFGADDPRFADDSDNPAGDFPEDIVSGKPLDFQQADDADDADDPLRAFHGMTDFDKTGPYGDRL